MSDQYRSLPLMSGDLSILNPGSDCSLIKDETIEKPVYKIGDIQVRPDGTKRKYDGKSWRILCTRDGCEKKAQLMGVCARHLRGRIVNRPSCGPFKYSRANTKRAATDRRFVPKPQKQPKKASLNINDIMDELNEENKRLLNELLFANQCLGVLNEFKAFICLYSRQFTQNLGEIQRKKFRELNARVEEVFRKKNSLIEDTVEENYSNVKNTVIEISNDTSNESKFDYISQQMNGKSFDANEVQKSVENTDYSNDANEDLDFKDNSGDDTNDAEYKLDDNEEDDEDYNENDSQDIGDDKESRRTGPIMIREKVFTCDYCGAEIKTYHSFVYHMRSQHLNRSGEPYVKMSERQLVCDVAGCGQVFNAELKINAHKLTAHGIERPYHCDFPGCDYTARTKHTLSEHKTTHTKVRPFGCSHEGCDKSYATQHQLRNHVSRFHTDRKFVCTYEGCGKSFRMKGQLNVHVRNIHEQRYRFGCEWPGCDFRSANKKDILRHHVKHTKDKQWKCDLCGLAFVTKYSLDNHKATIHQLGEKLYCTWPGCDWSSYSKHTHRQHELSHYTPGQYVCDWPECGKRMRHKRSLEEHVNTVHKNEKRFVCSHPGCQFRTAVGSNLRNHMKTHEKKTLNDLHSNQYVLNANEWQEFEDIDKELNQIVIKIDKNSRDIKIELTEDIKTNGEIGSEENTKNSSKRQMVCNDCGKQFSYEKSFKNHIRSHKKDQRLEDTTNQSLDYRRKINLKMKMAKKSAKKKNIVKSECNVSNDNEFLEKNDNYLKQDVNISENRNNSLNEMDKTEMNDIKAVSDVSEVEKELLERIQNYVSSDEDMDNDEDYVPEECENRRKSLKFVCRIRGCNKRFASVGHLKRHQACSHSKDKTFVCTHPNCDYSFSSTAFLNDHIIAKHSHRLPVGCPIKECDGRFEDELALKQHLENHSLIKKKFVCDFGDCPKMFSSEKLLKIHCNNVHIKNRVRCPHPGCESMVKPGAQLKVHMIKHSTDKPFVCPQIGCGKAFKTFKAQERHYNYHFDKKEYKCVFDGCTEGFATRVSLSNHTKSVHIQGEEFACDWPGCEYKTYVTANLDQHRFVHCDDYLYVCDRPGCSSKFKCKKYLYKHKNEVHRPRNRVFVCEWPGCDYKAEARHTLRVHIKRIHEAIAVPCDHPGCELSFKTAAELRRHYSQVHLKTKNLVCPWPGCSFRAFKRANLDRHQLSHTKEKPFACDWPECQFRSSQKSNVKIHVMSVHNKKNFLSDK